MTDLPKHVKYWFSEAKHDVYFLVGPESGPTERIGAMKTLLLGYSEPLRAMLQDSALAETRDVRLIDVEAEAFRNFLKCIYGGSGVVLPELDFDELVKLLYVTEKYLVEDIKDNILKYLENVWSPCKIFLALSHPLLFNSDILKENMINTIEKGFLELSKDPEFLKISDAAIIWILQQEKLNALEIEVWNAVLKWAQHQVNSDNVEALRSKIFPLLKYIRFLAMNCKDFCQSVVVSGILQKEEIIDILLSYNETCILKTGYLCKNRNHRYTTLRESANILCTTSEAPNCIIMLCTVNNFGSLNSTWFSKPVIFAEMPWQLMIRKTPEYGGSLSLYLKGNNYLRGWPNPIEHTCAAKVTCTLVNQLGKENLTRGSTHSFDNKENDWGWRNFISWGEVKNPEKGFIKDNRIIVMVSIQLIN